MNALTLALKNGLGSDERLQEIEMNMRVCQSQYNNIIKSLIEKKPPLGTSDDKSKNLRNFYFELLK